ncbi:MAG TPA: hypothetical protein VFW78_07870 [Bacteroidia bacterium]|nr:hypothetical protein [Bacteroidia bacterium]
MAQKVKKEIKGGVRKGAGRKPVADPKVMVPLYIETSIISALGGLEEVRSACYSFIRSKIDNKKQN